MGEVDYEHEPKNCEHYRFRCECKVNRLTHYEGGPVTGYSADISIRCADCHQQFAFQGCPIGYSPNQPMVSVDGLELRAPLRPIQRKGELIWP